MMQLNSNDNFWNFLANFRPQNVVLQQSYSLSSLCTHEHKKSTINVNGSFVYLKENLSSFLSFLVYFFLSLYSFVFFHCFLFLTCFSFSVILFFFFLFFFFLLSFLFICRYFFLFYFYGNYVLHFYGKFVLICWRIIACTCKNRSSIQNV